MDIKLTEEELVRIEAEVHKFRPQAKLSGICFMFTEPFDAIKAREEIGQDLEPGEFKTLVTTYAYGCTHPYIPDPYPHQCAIIAEEGDPGYFSPGEDKP